MFKVDYKFTIRSYLINAKEMEEGRIDSLFKLLKNSMKAHKIIYVVLILSQIIGMVCLIFLYGVFAEFNGRK